MNKIIICLSISGSRRWRKERGFIKPKDFEKEVRQYTQVHLRETDGFRAYKGKVYNTDSQM